MLKVTPPKESMGTRPKKIQELMFYFSKTQYDFLNAINVEIESEEYNELNESEKADFETSFKLQLNSYESMQNLIENY